MKGDYFGVVLSLFPNARGFAFVAFENLAPFDWGVSDVRGARRNQVYMKRITAVLDRHEPEVLVLRDVSRMFPRPVRRVVRLVETIEELAATRSIATFAVSREHVQEAFGDRGRVTRLAIVEAIVEQFPMFGPLVPPVRKIWQSEHRTMGLFDALANALTFFHQNPPLSAEAAHRAAAPSRSGASEWSDAPAV